jgi:hypothetical protein
VLACFGHLTSHSNPSCSSLSRRARVSGDAKKAVALERIICRQSLVESFMKQHKAPKVAVDEGLKNILVSIMNRRLRQEYCNERELMLRQVLGDRFLSVMNLVHEIGMARLARASNGCGSGMCSRLPGLASRMPTPVKRLFFHNELCHIVQKGPIAKLSEQNWDVLIEQAERDLEQYRLWTSQFDGQCPRKRSFEELKTDLYDNVETSNEDHPQKMARRVSNENYC